MRESYRPASRGDILTSATRAHTGLGSYTPTTEDIALGRLVESNHTRHSRGAYRVPAHTLYSPSANTQKHPHLPAAHRAPLHNLQTLGRRPPGGLLFRPCAPPPAPQNTPQQPYPP